MTVTVTVQAPNAGMVIPVPAACVPFTPVSNPPHVVDGSGVNAVVTPAGYTSVKAVAVAAALVGLVKVNFNADVPPLLIDAGVSDKAAEGGAAATVSVKLMGAGFEYVTAPLKVNPPTGIVKV